MRGATSVILQRHQMRLPGKMILMINPCHILWDVIYNARSNSCYPPTSPNTAPAGKKEFHDWSSSHMKTLFTMRVRSEHDPKMIRAWTRQPATRIATEDTFRAHHEHFLLKKTIRAPAIIPIFTKCCTCHEKWHLNFTKYCAAWTSPNTAPPTKSNCHDWSSSHMKRHLQWGEQQRSPSNITTYCAWHEKWRSKIVCKFLERSWNVIYNERPIRAWSEYDPAMNPSVRNPPRNRGYFSRSPREFPIEKNRIRAPATIPTFTKCCTCHEKWHLNFTKYCPCHEKWSWTSPNTAPPTKSNCHDWSSSHMKRHLQCAEQ